MFKKLNKKGFTLAELLVVVAIIGVLVAVSIPIFTSQLAKARYATNQANLRAAKAAMVTEMLADGHSSDAKTYVGVYHVSSGVLDKPTETTITATIDDADINKTFADNTKINTAGTYQTINVSYSTTTAGAVTIAYSAS